MSNEMSSWLGSGLSQLTGQISSFTKEVLTEGTEEVDDHETQFKLARSRVAELEAICTSQKNEIDKISKINAELQDQLASSELQINAISKEYRNVIQQKETEIQKLQHKYQALIDGGQHSPGSDIASLSFGNASLQFSGEKQGEQESQHGVEHYLAKIQALEAQLSSEKDTHQVELAALQDVHSQKTKDLKRVHKQEAKKFQAQIDELYEKLDQHQETVQAVDKSKQEDVEKLRKHIKKLEEDKQEIAAKYQTLHDFIYPNSTEDGEIVDGQNQLQVDNDTPPHKMNFKLNSPPFSAFSTPIGKGKPTPVVRNDNLGDGTDDPILVSEFGQVFSEHSENLDSKVHTLKNQVDKYEKEIEHFEIVKSDWLAEKEALEEVLMKLRLDLRQKEEALTIAQTQQPLKDESVLPAPPLNPPQPLEPSDQHNAFSERGLYALEEFFLHHLKALSRNNNNDLDMEVKNADNNTPNNTTSDDDQKKDMFPKRSIDREYAHYDEIVDVDDDPADVSSGECHDLYITSCEDIDADFGGDGEEYGGDLVEDVIKPNKQVNLLTRGSSKLKKMDDSVLVKKKQNLLKDLESNKDKVSALEKQLETATKEKDSLRTKLEELENEMRTLREQQQQQKSAPKGAVKTEADGRKSNDAADEAVRDELEKTKAQLVEAFEERDSLMGSLEELDTQHQQAIDQCIYLLQENS